ncbi:hypothetical protein SCRES1_gp83 [Synechococcus phage S-CRES1]|nr:hypothetical protein SCRES1_gp83 [Synechococcus phage S-CRES1]
MSINPTSISSQSIKENTDVVIEMRYEKPSLTETFDPPDIPGRIIGYYNGATGFMELYVFNRSGTKLLQV